MITLKELKEIVGDLGYELNVHGKLNIVGQRNKTRERNKYTDVISIFQNTPGGWKERHFEATTLPGTPNLLKPVNLKGTAILVPGQYVDSYAIGLHRNKYKALIQVLPVRVYRDNDRDDMCDPDETYIDEGLFGINIHRASLLNTVVGADSAGCQVIKKRSDFGDFMKWCTASGQRRFTYTLIEI